MEGGRVPEGLGDMLAFPLWDALLGRRSRRFFRGAEIPDGVLRYRSRHPPMPLDEVERACVVAACGGSTAWHHMIYRAARYAPHLSTYAGAAGGRTFPSAAGFHTSMTFFTDDDGVYVLDGRDAPPLTARDGDGRVDLEAALAALRGRIRKLAEGRLRLPAEVPFVEAHNTWVVNQPGSLLVIPVADLAQHVLLALCYMVQNGYALFDDVNRRPVPGLEAYADLFDPDRVWPLTFLEQLSLGEVAVELGASCYGGALALQAMGLGGWMFDGIDPFAMLGASGDPAVPGLGFRYDADDRWPYPNPTGLPGVLEATCPPHVPDMRAAVELVCERKFGPGGPFHPDTPGPWKDTPRVRAAALPYDARFRACVALQAQYVFDTFGKFPATVPSVFTLMYLHAFHLDLDFYDHFFEPGAYLESHAEHMARWHGAARRGDAPRSSDGEGEPPAGS